MFVVKHQCMVMANLKPIRPLGSMLDNRLYWQTNFTMYLHCNIFNLATNDSFKLLRTRDKIPADEAQSVATDRYTVNDVHMTAVMASPFCARCSIPLQSPKSMSNSPKRLHTQSPRNFAWQPSARVSETLRPFYFSHVIKVATLADEYWQLHRPDCRNTLIYAHMISRTHLTCDISLGSLTLRAPEARDFVELVLPYISPEPLRFPVRLLSVYFRPVA
jgi:hypothetical protein